MHLLLIRCFRSHQITIIQIILHIGIQIHPILIPLGCPPCPQVVSILYQYCCHLIFYNHFIPVKIIWKFIKTYKCFFLQPHCLYQLFYGRLPCGNNIKVTKLFLQYLLKPCGKICSYILLCIITILFQNLCDLPLSIPNTANWYQKVFSFWHIIIVGCFFQTTPVSIFTSYDFIFPN